MNDDRSERREMRSAFLVLMPVYDDWAAVRLLLPELDEQFRSAGLTADVLLVNDCSTEPPPPALRPANARALGRVDVLTLARNLGHQRAIAVGLSHVAATVAYRGIVVMDSDGEDAPGDVVRLLDAFEQQGGSAVVFAQRRKRSEGFIFTVFYHGYRLLHRLLTGIAVQVGNFSVIPGALLARITTSSELWNHYAASVYQARVPVMLVPTERSQRVAGASRMNFVGLVAHGLGAMAVFADRIGVRLLIGAGILGVLLVIGLVAAIGIRLFTDAAIPGWATVATGVLLILLVQSAMLGLVFAFMIQHSRAGSAFIPARDYAVFIESVVGTAE